MLLIAPLACIIIGCCDKRLDRIGEKFSKIIPKNSGTYRIFLKKIKPISFFFVSTFMISFKLITYPILGEINILVAYAYKLSILFNNFKGVI